jgi:peptidyl-tRNA hydrolase
MRQGLAINDGSNGHAGGKSVDKSTEDNADQQQFLRWRIGMAQPTPWG